MLRLLTKLGETPVLVEFIDGVVMRHYDGSENLALAACAPSLGAEQTGRLYAELVRHHTPIQPGRCVELLRALTSARGAAEKSGWREALRQISKAAVSQLDEIEKTQRANEWSGIRGPETARAVDAALVANLLEVLREIEAPKLRLEAAEKFIARPAVFDPVAVLVPALGLIEDVDAAWNRLWDHSAEFLLRRSGEPPEPPKDWRQDVKLSCTCVDCRELQAFMLDPTAQIHRFRVRQDRRSHLEQQITHRSLDMAYVTDRKGTPQTLVCTKNHRTYQLRCRQYTQDITALASLEKLAGRTSGYRPAALKQIADARARASAWSPDSAA